MIGRVSALGVGGSPLNNDLIDKLRKADETSVTARYEARLQNNKTQQEDFQAIKSLSEELKKVTSSLSGDMLYLSRKGSVSGDSVSAEVLDGSQIQDFQIDVKQLAQRTIRQTQSFEGDTYKGETGKLEISYKVNGQEKTANVDVTNGMRLADLKDAITDATDGHVIGSVLNVGEGKNTLVMKSKDTGLGNSFDINFKSSSPQTQDPNAVDSTPKNSFLAYELDESGKSTGKLKGQDGQDAKFIYNGVEVSRSSNKINGEPGAPDLLVTGVNFELKKTGVSEVKITQNTDKIKEDLQKFVIAYNELNVNISAATKFDQGSNKAGSLQGNSILNSIMQNIKQSVASNFGNFNANQDKFTMEDIGISLNRNGTLQLDEKKLDDALSKNADKIETFLRGTDGDTVEHTHGEYRKTSKRMGGFMENIDQALKDALKPKGGLFELLGSDLKEKGERMQDALDEAKQKIDKKYEIMTSRFVAFDSMIQKMNANFSSLKAIIESERKGK